MHFIFAIITYTNLAGPERIEPVAVDLGLMLKCFMLIFF